MRIRALSIITIFVLFIACIGYRFSEPFGFFRESNPAIVCINAHMWDANPDMKEAGVPITSFAFDRSKKPGQQLYQTVVTFGNAWFLLPYYYHLLFPALSDEWMIRSFALLWFLVGMAGVWLLAGELAKDFTRRKTIQGLTLLLYGFSEVTMWYHVRGYVHESAVVPVYLFSWWLFIKYLRTGAFQFIMSVTVMLIAALQFDWLPFFQGIVMSAWLLVQRRRMMHSYAFVLPAAAILIGTILVFYPYVQWAGWDVLSSHLEEKFIKRSIRANVLELAPGLSHHLNLFVFYLAGYGILPFLLLRAVVKRSPAKPFIWLIVLTALMHHLVFWSFSSEHDHSVLKMAFPIAFIAAVQLRKLHTGKLLLAVSAAVAVNLLIYFSLHFGLHRGGMYQNSSFCYDAGVIIKKQFSSGDLVFVNTGNKYLPQLEYYAGRPYIPVNNKTEAQQYLLKALPHQKAFFLQQINGQIVGAVRLR